MDKKPILFWIIWLILTISIILPFFVIRIYSSDVNVQVKQCLSIDLSYIASNGSIVYIPIGDKAADYKVNGTVYIAGSYGYTVWPVEDQAIFLGLRYYTPLYVLVDNRSIFVCNIVEMPYLSDSLGCHLSNLFLKPEPWYSVTLCLEDFFSDSWSEYTGENDLGKLLVDVYYNATGKDSGAFEAYINATVYMLVYTGHQLVTATRKWTFIKFKIYYSNLTLDKTYIHVEPCYTYTIKLKTIPIQLIKCLSYTYNVLFPLSIIMLLAGLIIKRTRAVIKKHYRIVLAATGILLIVASLILSMSPYGIYAAYIGIRSITVNGEPWPGTLQNNTIILRDVEGILKAKVDVSCTCYESLVFEIIAYADGRIKELYKKYVPYKTYGTGDSLIPIGPEDLSGSIVLRAAYLDFGTLRRIQAKILSVEYSQGTVKIRLNPQLIVGYNGTQFNEINLLLAAIGSGMLVTAILGPRDRKTSNTRLANE